MPQLDNLFTQILDLDTFVVVSLTSFNASINEELPCFVDITLPLFADYHQLIVGLNHLVF